MTEPLLVARNAQIECNRLPGMAKSAVRSMGSAVGREIIRGMLGGIMGSKSR
jgi:hypothetical protein